MEGVKVYIGEKLVTSVDRRSPTELRLRTPSGTLREKAARVVNPDGQEDVEEAGFTYFATLRMIQCNP